MQEEAQGGGWLKWLIIIPVCMAGGALVTRWALKPLSAPRAETPAVQEAPSEVAPAPAPAAAPAKDNFELQSDDVTSGEAGVIWTGKPGETAPAARQAAAPAASAKPADPAAVKKDTETGFMYGALTKVAGKLLDNPKALTALFNNDYVVKGFMSRDTVKNATASKASLAAYLKNPANLSKFMAKAPVQEGLKRPDLLGAMADTKMVAAMLDTPGGKALLADPDAIAAIAQANPDLALVLANPNVVSALMSNPRTSVILNQGLSKVR